MEDLHLHPLVGMALLFFKRTPYEKINTHSSHEHRLKCTIVIVLRTRKIRKFKIKSNPVFFETNQQATVVINIIAKYIRTPILEYKNRASDVVKINIVHDRLNNKKPKLYCRKHNDYC